jgi:hypothetical protein
LEKTAGTIIGMIKAGKSLNCLVDIMQRILLCGVRDSQTPQ